MRESTTTRRRPTGLKAHLVPQGVRCTQATLEAFGIHGHCPTTGGGLLEAVGAAGYGYIVHWEPGQRIKGGTYTLAEAIERFPLAVALSEPGTVFFCDNDRHVPDAAGYIRWEPPAKRSEPMNERTPTHDPRTLWTDAEGRVWSIEDGVNGHGITIRLTGRGLDDGLGRIAAIADCANVLHLRAAEL